MKSQVGEAVAAYGFPYAGLLSSSGNFTTGTLASLSGMNDDSRFIQTSAPVQPGNSGGPLLDMSGSVVGVVVGQLNAVKMMKFADSIPQNINFAIQAPIVVNFLSAKGHSPKSDSSAAHNDLQPSAVAEIAQKIAVQVYCDDEPSSQSASASAATPPPAAISPPQGNVASAIETRARAFAVSVQERWSQPNSAALASLDELYDEQVMFYGKKTSRPAVVKEKTAFAQRFSQRTYKTKEPVSVWCNENTCTVHGLVDYRAIDPAAKIVSSGVATFDYLLDMSGANIRIKAENGEVLSRNRSSL